MTDLVTDPEIDADVQRYRVEHRTSYSYGAAMTDGYTVACLVPRPRPWQQVLESTVSVEPHPSEHDSYLDAFGNLIHEFGVHEPHRAVTVTARSVVDLGTPDVPDDDTPWEGVVASLDQARGKLAIETGFFRSASTFVDLADLGVALRSIAARSFTDGRSIIDGARALCDDIDASFRFDAGFSDVSTPLTYVLSARTRGVPGLRPPGDRMPALDRAGGALRERLHRDRTTARPDPIGGCRRLARLVLGVDAARRLGRLRSDQWSAPDQRATSPSPGAATTPTSRPSAG